MYNIVNKDGSILETQTELRCVKWQKNGLNVLCKKEDAQGVISNDNETIYALKGRNAPEGEEVTLEEKSTDAEVLKAKSDVADVMEAQADLYELLTKTEENQIAIMDAIAEIYEAK